MNDLPTLEHALYGGQDAGGYRFLARSPGFRDEWLPEAERLCTGFGERPAGVACPRAVFAQPLGKEHVAVVHAADQGADDQGRPGTLGFHLVILPANLYAWLGADPFYLADHLPTPWTARGHLSPLVCPAPSPPRLVTDIQKVLNVEQSATLLGATQALIDGGRLVFERSAPDEGLFRSLWALLPAASRAEIWPASFAFGNALAFHVVAVPRITAEFFAIYLLEGQAGDYPEGKYELDLQIAAEAGDQGMLDGLLARRSARETRRLGLILLVVVMLFPLFTVLLNRKQKEAEPAPKPKQEQKREEEDDKHTMPGNEQFSPLTPQQTAALRTRLLDLATDLKVKVPPVPSAPILTIGVGGGNPLGASALLLLDRRDWMSPEALILDAIDRHLKNPDPKRFGDLHNLGPVERQLRGLLYKHEVPRWHDLRLQPSELVEHLQEKLRTEKKP